jgi:hypothetical protein
MKWLEHKGRPRLYIYFYIEPIAKYISGDNEEGVDVGFQFGFIFITNTFPLFRFIELYFVKQWIILVYLNLKSNHYLNKVSAIIFIFFSVI